jgi:hypothetical protein
VREIELEGRVAALNGSCPAVSFRIHGQLVYVDSSTKFDDEGCASLRNGREVEVKGTLMSDDTIRASEIEIDD